MQIDSAFEKLKSLTKPLWGLLLFTLPFTTFPYMLAVLGKTVVKPLAFYPLVLLFALLIWIAFRKRQLDLPSNSSVLIAFLMFALFTSLVAFLNNPIDLRGVSYLDRSLRAWLSLMIGLTFFITAYWMNRSEEDLQFSLRWVYAALLLTIIWGLIQAIALNTNLLSRSLINQIQVFFSERAVQPRRISGFANEPAWLADQILLFYMPWLYAAFLARSPIKKGKWVDAILVILAFALLLFTYSRSGLLGALITILVTSAFVARDKLREAFWWLTQPFAKANRQDSSSRLWIARVVLVALLVIGAFGSVSFLGQYDYFANLWQAREEQTLVDYLGAISVAQRVAYAEAGYRVFEEYPLSGVGLGGSALYLYEQLPDWSRNLQEIARQLSPDSVLIPNIKSLYVRLLAETGLVGFWLFVSFKLSFLYMLRRQYLSQEPYAKFVAVAGLFFWIGLAIRNLTQDSLTFPIMWVSLGIIAGLSPEEET